MAEGFGAYYHVPQHSRREKLRVSDSVRRVYDPSNLMTTKPQAVNFMGFDNSSSDPSFPDNFGDFEVGRSEFDAHGVFVFVPEPLSLSLSSNNLGGVDTAVVGVGGDVARGSVPLGPFTGYASVLRGSRFLEPARMLLEEFCGGVGPAGLAAAEDTAEEDFPPEIGGGDGGENQRKMSTLISMLDEVYKRYKQYYQQMQEIAASFESVAGLGNAAPCTNIALKTMSKHFKSLRDAISDQLKFTNKCQLGHGKNEAGKSDSGFYSQRGVNNSNSGCFENQPVWRPHRGLPERAVAVLRAWLFEHFLHPYPTDTDKLMLAKQTGLSRCQVSNWFINARVRLWKPMVEEIHMLETRQAHKGPQRNGEGNDNNNNDGRPNKYSKSASTVARGGGVVSLTLGLHQNNCMSSFEPFPMHAPQRFCLGAEGNGDGYVMGGFEAEHRHFGREATGGQLLHDFVD